MQGFKTMRGLATAIGVAALLAAAAPPSASTVPQAMAASPASASLPAGDGSFVFTGWKGPPVKVYTHLPDHVTATTPIVFVMHGMLRDPIRYRNEWRALADSGRFILITPEFDQKNFPHNRAYNYGGFRTRDGSLRPRDEWTFAAIDPLFEQVRHLTGSRVQTFAIYGHSAGAQFTHRYVLLTQDPLVGIAISANAGSYTMPVLDIDYPYGLRGAPVDEAGLKRALAMPLVVLLGTADIDPNHRELPRDPEAMAQGPYRLARGNTFYATAKAAADRLHTPFNWTLQFAPGVAHSDRDMAPFAAKILAQHFAVGN